MTGLRRNSRFAANLMLALLLVAAQTSALVHAYQHDPGAVQNQACTACVTASQLAFACVDNPAVADIHGCSSPVSPPALNISPSITAIVVRQRGPPSPL